MPEAAMRKTVTVVYGHCASWASFGTTNNRGGRSVRELRTIADREGMWLHADAAYGGRHVAPPSRAGLRQPGYGARELDNDGSHGHRMVTSNMPPP